MDWMDILLSLFTVMNSSKSNLQMFNMLIPLVSHPQITKATVKHKLQENVLHCPSELTDTLYHIVFSNSLLQTAPTVHTISNVRFMSIAREPYGMVLVVQNKYK